MAELTDAQRATLESGLSKLKANDSALLRGATKEQLGTLSGTLSAIKANLASISGGGITSDSSSASRTETAIKRDIEDITTRSGIGDTPDTSDLEKLREDQQREIERQRRLLEARRKKEVAGINEGYDVERTATEFQQTRETGQTSVGLARAGGYLGVTASQTGVLQNLVKTQREEIRALEGQRQAALRAANNAYEDRDFELAKEGLKSAREIEAEIFNRKNIFFNQQLDILGEERAQMQAFREDEETLRKRAQDRLEDIVNAGITPEDEDIFDIARGLGYSTDETTKIIDAAKQAKELDEKDQKTDREIAIINTLRGIPRDQTVVIDGVTYRGLAELKETGSATERAKAEETRIKQQFMDDLWGTWGGREDNELITMPIEEAIKLYPELSIDYIQGVYKALEDAEDKKEMASNIQNGTWDVTVVDYPGDSKGPQEVVYDKQAYKQAIESWASEAKAGFWNAGEFKGDDQADDLVTVIIDGVEYTGKGVKDKDGNAFAPYYPEDFAVSA